MELNKIPLCKLQSQTQKAAQIQIALMEMNHNRLRISISIKQTLMGGRINAKTVINPTMMKKRS